MAIKADNEGSLSFTEIAAEWNKSRGATDTHSLDEYHSGESLVFAGAADGSGNAIPSSGTISFSDFYDTTSFAEPGSFTTITSSTTAVVTAGANAILINQAVGGGGEGLNGLGYDRSGVESSGPGGGAGGFVSEKVFNVTAGETITFTIGAGGSGKASNSSYSSNSGYGAGFLTSFGILWGDTSDAVSGGTTTVSGSSTGTLITLAGGSGATNGGGGVQGPKRTQGAGSGGGATINGTALTSGTTSGGTAVSSFANSSGSGGTGVGGNAVNNSAGNHFNGDNTNEAGGNGGASNFQAGGTGSSSGSTSPGGNGSEGSGGGGGSALGNIARSLGGQGGAGFVSFKFLQVN